MSSKKKLSFLNTVTFRLTMLFVVLFILLLIAVFVPIDLTLRSIMLSRLDDKITTSLSNFSYYGDLFDRKTKEEATGIILDNLRWAAQIEGNDNVLWLMLSAQHETITSSNTQHWQGDLQPIIESIPVFPDQKELSQSTQPGILNHNGFTFVETDGVRHIAAFKTLTLPNRIGRFRTAFMKVAHDMIIISVYSLNDIDRQMARYRKVLAIAFAFVLLAGGGLGFLTTRHAMTGVRRVTYTAMAIGKGDLSRRVALGRQGSEIEELASTFNEMLGRIQTLVKELKEVTTNVAHDLRSPITRIRGAAETTLQSDETIETYRDVNGQIISECDRLVEMINTMLEIAQMDSGVAELPGTEINLAGIVEDACELFRPVAEDKDIELNYNKNNEQPTVTGSKGGLQRVVANIIDNAIKFTEPGGKVNITLNCSNSQVSISITDTGCGIQEENQGRIFDRFYRADPSRTSEGNGLGLSLAQSIVRAHGGTITLESQIDKGSRFTINLPRHK